MADALMVGEVRVATNGTRNVLLHVCRNGEEAQLQDQLTLSVSSALSLIEQLAEATKKAVEEPTPCSR